MSQANTDDFAKVAKFLSERSAPKYRFAITYDTEIWKDLGIYGDDLYELAKWLNEAFGVEPTHSDFVFCYAPTEHFAPLGIIRRAFGLERQYKSLTVRRILEIIDAGRWPNPNLQHLP